MIATGRIYSKMLWHIMGIVRLDFIFIIASSINKSQRIVTGIRIPVPGLGIPRLRRQRIRLDEAPQRRVVPASVVEV
jgi:hypothetical protein